MARAEKLISHIEGRGGHTWRKKDGQQNVAGQKGPPK